MIRRVMVALLTGVLIVGAGFVAPAASAHQGAEGRNGVAESNAGWGIAIEPTTPLPAEGQFVQRTSGWVGDDQFMGAPAVDAADLGHIAAATRQADTVVDAGKSASTKIDDLADSCRINSFVPATLVLMADGSTKPIDQVQVGDLVMASDPGTGEQGVRRVTDTIVGDGAKHLVDVEIDGEVVTATGGHPFWVVDQASWVNAQDHEPGDVVFVADGTTATIDWDCRVSR